MRRILRFLTQLFAIGVLCVPLVGAPELAGQPSQLHATLEGHTAAVVAVVFSPSGKTLASGSRDDTIKLWHLGNPAKAKPLTVELDKGEAISTLSFNSNGKKLAWGTKANITVFDVQNEKKDMQIDIGKTNTGACVVFSPNDKLLAWSHKKTITFWDVSATSIVKAFDPAQPTLTRIAFGPDGKTVVSIDSHDASKRQILLWEVSSGKLLGTIAKAHQFGVARVAFTPDGKTLVSTGLDAKGSKAPGTPPVVPPPPMPNSPYHDGDIKFWDVATLGHIKTLHAHDQAIPAIAVSPDGKYLASGGMDKLVKLWDLASAQCLATLEGHTERVLSVAFSPDGKTLASGSADKTIKLWSIAK